MFGYYYLHLGVISSQNTTLTHNLLSSENIFAYLFRWIYYFISHSIGFRHVQDGCSV